MQKIIIDTDPGIDDAMAIFFAFQSPDLDVIGLTCTYGNVPVTMAAKNARILCEIAKKDIPVCQGVGMPWVGPESGYAQFVHGDNGLGDIELPEPTTELDPRHSAQFIVDMAHKYPGEVTIVAIGPLGNLALALRIDPSITKLLKGVVIMGGSALAPGNVTPVAEANIWNDAHAAEAVFQADWDVTMIGLDVTYAVSFNQAFLEQLESVNAELGGFVNRCSQFYKAFYSQDRDEGDVVFFHDSMALAYLIDPSLYKMESGRIRVVTDSFCIGQTTYIADSANHIAPAWADAQSVNVALEVDNERLTKLYVDTYAL